MKPPQGTYIKEVVLENFMSYEYARVPLRPGLNIVAGPNGAGKSSIVLAIAVALGQTYTERSKRLRDLIRRGERLARVTVVFDNTPVNGKRPIPFSREDEVRISRYLRSDGTYWFEINYRTVDKYELTSRLARMGIDPDNMIVIMHQGTMAEFASMNPRERLVMVEEAAGLHEYRERVLRAMEELAGIEVEISKAQDLLRRAQETLGLWKMKYERLLERRGLEAKAKRLKAELAWSKYEHKLEIVRSLEESIEEAEGRERTLQSKVESLKAELDKLEQRLADGWESLLAEINPEAVVEVECVSRLWRTFMDLHREIVEKAVSKALAESELKGTRELLSKLRTKLRKEKKELEEFRSEAESVERPEGKLRSPEEIVDELKLVGARLASLGDVSDEVEEMYRRYEKTYDEIRHRVEQLEINRKEVLEALTERAEYWRKMVSELVSEVNREFGEILQRLGGVGSIGLVEADDVRTAGLEIVAGFRGMDPVPLESRALSGGERAATVMAFLLSLQKHVKSPVRIVDEFDVHMDPFNREAAIREFARILAEAGGQSILVTPGPPPEVEGPVHILIVQRVEGASRVSEA